MKYIALIFYVLSGVLLVSAVNTTMPVLDSEGYAFIIGAYFPALVCFLIGLALNIFSKLKTRVKG